MNEVRLLIDQQTVKEPTGAIGQGYPRFSRIRIDLEDVCFAREQRWLFTRMTTEEEIESNEHSLLLTPCSNRDACLLTQRGNMSKTTTRRRKSRLNWDIRRQMQVRVPSSFVFCNVFDTKINNASSQKEQETEQERERESERKKESNSI